MDFVFLCFVAVAAQCDVAVYRASHARVSLQLSVSLQLTDDKNTIEGIFAHLKMYFCEIALS